MCSTSEVLFLNRIKWLTIGTVAHCYLSIILFTQYVSHWYKFIFIPIRYTIQSSWCRRGYYLLPKHLFQKFQLRITSCFCHLWVEPAILLPHLLMMCPKCLFTNCISGSLRSRIGIGNQFRSKLTPCTVWNQTSSSWRSALGHWSGANLSPSSLCLVHYGKLSRKYRRKARSQL